jgi:hypothetical protein
MAAPMLARSGAPTGGRRVQLNAPARAAAANSNRCFQTAADTPVAFLKKWLLGYGGASVMAAPGASTDIVYSDGCRIPVRPGSVAAVAPIDPVGSRFRGRCGTWERGPLAPQTGELRRLRPGARAASEELDEGLGIAMLPHFGHLLARWPARPCRHTSPRRTGAEPWARC